MRSSNTSSLINRKIIAIDAGHGGQDQGASAQIIAGSPERLAEKDVTFTLAKRVVAKLSEIDILDPHLVRSQDEFIALNQRTRFANGLMADAFISIHINSAQSTSANGFESYIFTSDGENSESFSLQSALHQYLDPIWENAGRDLRGRKKANFAVLRTFVGASVLLELGFISNVMDRDLIQNEAFLDQLAEGISQGIEAYFQNID